MPVDGTLALFLGAVALGAVHGVEPGHGWPVAASYALNQSRVWFHGVAAGLVIGIGHLVSSIAMVGVFFYLKEYFDLTQVNEPITVAGGVTIGGPVSVVAGVLLVGLGIREYVHGHSHGDGHAHDDGHSHGNDHIHDHGHSHGHDDRSHDGGSLDRLKSALPFVGGHSHAHSREEWDERADRGLFSIAWFAFVLGFAHEEEFEIILLCSGSDYCLELMATYALTVVAGILALTLALVSGYEHFEEEVEQYTPYLPAFSAAVLVVMGVGFITGLF